MPTPNTNQPLLHMEALGIKANQLTSEPTIGKPVSHAFAKEMLAGLAGAEIDKLAETKGEDFVDRERAKHAAKQNVEKMYDDHYINDKGADQYDP